MKQDLHAEVTARIVAQLETGVRPWMRPWTTGESVAGRPLRATGEPYRGINTLILWEASLIRGYHAPTWITFRQAGFLMGMGQKASVGVSVGPRLSTALPSPVPMSIRRRARKQRPGSRS